MLAQTDTRYKSDFYYYTNDTIIGKSIEIYGEYSQCEIDFLLLFINSSSVVYDIGANIGYHSLAFASKASRVYSFEPNEQSFQLLEKNTNHLSNLFSFNVAVGDATNEKVFIERLDLNTPTNYGMAKITSESDSSHEIKIVSLDSLDLAPPSLIKIDVEGFELKVINGATRIIENHNPIVFYEVQDHNQFKDDFKIMYRYFKSLNYKLYWFPSPNYNSNNYKNNLYNWSPNGVIFSILALPKKFKDFPLFDVESENDTYLKFMDNRFSESVKAGLSTMIDRVAK